jgi:hypothetical protein
LVNAWKRLASGNGEARILSWFSLELVRVLKPFRVKKSNFAVTQLFEGAVGVNVSSITSDKYGDVTVTQGNGVGDPPVFGFAVFGPSGELEEDGGGASYLLNTTTGLSTSTLPQ